LGFFPDDMQPGEVREITVEERHHVDGKTDDKGVFEVTYVPPSSPGLWARLFGAEEVGEQWITLTYEDAARRTFTYKVFVEPR
jgi:hypothetical protein